LVERKKREDTGSVLREGHKAETVKIYDIIKDYMISYDASASSPQKRKDRIDRECVLYRQNGVAEVAVNIQTRSVAIISIDIIFFLFFFFFFF